LAENALFVAILGQICITFGANLAHFFLNYAVTAPSEGAILEGFNEQHQYQNSQKSTILDDQLTLFGANKVQIQCKF
jgi:hypothetical protein